MVRQDIDHFEPVLFAAARRDLVPEHGLLALIVHEVGIHEFRFAVGRLDGELPGSSLRFATLAQRRDSLWAMFSGIERRVANEETIPNRGRPCRAKGTAMG